MNYLEFEQPIYELEKKISELKSFSSENHNLNDEIKRLNKKLEKLTHDVYSDLNDWQKARLSRHPERPYTLDYIDMLFRDFQELHGDRNFSDDKAIVGGLATFEGHGVMIVGHQKGRTTKEKIYRNFGMTNPEGNRKALRLMSLAERLSLPIFTFVDTPGAYPGIGAEERGQAEAIAKNIMVMARLKVPIITTIIGEGGSGGALALAVGNRVNMMQYATYSVISPESCAAILWRDASYAEKAAKALRITSKNMLALKVVDAIIPEADGGAHRNFKNSAENLRAVLSNDLKALLPLSREALLEQRYNRFRSLGTFKEGAKKNGKSS